MYQKSDDCRFHQLLMHAMGLREAFKYEVLLVSVIFAGSISNTYYKSTKLKVLGNCSLRFSEALPVATVMQI